MYRTINFRDVCAAGRYFTGVPELDRLVTQAPPCVFITALDCYWEGSLLQFPDNYVAPINVTACIVDNPIIGDQSEGITWGNIDFDTVRSCLLANLTTSRFSPYIDLVCTNMVLTFSSISLHFIITVVMGSC